MEEEGNTFSQVVGAQAKMVRSEPSRGGSPMYLPPEVPNAEGHLCIPALVALVSDGTDELQFTL